MELNLSTLNKYNAYKEVASNYDEAKAIIEGKKLAYGETAVVSFYFPGRTSEVKTIEQMLGVGGINGNVMIYSNILGTSSRVDDATVFIASENRTMTVTEAFAWLTNEIDGETRSILSGIKTAIENQTATITEKFNQIDQSLKDISSAINKLYRVEVVG